MTDPTPPPLPPTPPRSSKAARRAILLTAALAMIGLSVTAWMLASTPDTDTDGEVGDPAAPSGPTETGRPPTLELEVERYVALGDSMTSAPYLPEWEQVGGCGRSSRNYPSRVAETLQVPEFVDVSCGGATTDDMWGSQYPGTAPQLDAVTARTDLVTLTIGGNDFGNFRNTVAGCARLSARDPGGSPCRAAATASGTDLLADRIDSTGPLVRSVLREIHKRAPDATVVLIGYPRFVPEAGTCPEILPFAAGDLPYVASRMSQLNEEQRAAAESTDTEFLDMYAASEGHDPCSSEPWMNGAHAVAGGAAAFHSFPEGQAAVADRLLALLD